jgi:hypothetical protein
VTKDRPAHFAPRRQSEPRVRIVECRLNPRAVEQISCEVLAARLAHLFGLEERAANALLCMLAETIPSLGVRFCRSVEEVFQ